MCRLRPQTMWKCRKWGRPLIRIVEFEEFEAELCDLLLANFDPDRGAIIVHGKGNQERRIALGCNALVGALH